MYVKAAWDDVDRLRLQTSLRIGGLTANYHGPSPPQWRDTISRLYLSPSPVPALCGNADRKASLPQQWIFLEHSHLRPSGAFRPKGNGAGVSAAETWSRALSPSGWHFASPARDGTTEPNARPGPPVVKLSGTTMAQHVRSNQRCDRLAQPAWRRRPPRVPALPCERPGYLSTDLPRDERSFESVCETIVRLSRERLCAPRDACLRHRRSGRRRWYCLPSGVWHTFP